MKKSGIFSAIITYIVIVVVVVGINFYLSMPINDLIKEAGNIQSLQDIEDQINIYESFCRIFSNMNVALLAIIALALVSIGLVLRVNTARNKEMYNAIILSGITVIGYLFWFVINISNSYIGIM